MVLMKMWYFGDCCELLTGVWMGAGPSEAVGQYLVTLKMIIHYNLDVFIPLQGPCSLKCSPRTSSINIIWELNTYVEFHPTATKSESPFLWDLWEDGMHMNIWETTARGKRRLIKLNSIIHSSKIWETTRSSCTR